MTIWLRILVFNIMICPSSTCSGSKNFPGCQPGTHYATYTDYYRLYSTCKNCPSSTFQPNWGTCNTACTPCSGACGNTQKRTATCTDSSNSVCAECSGGTYKTETTCSNCAAACSASQKETQSCTASSNRACAECSGGTYNSDGVTCSNCAAACSASQKETQACTASSNRACAECSSGTYKSDGVTCSNCAAACSASQKETQACTTSLNRVCAECSSGTYKRDGVTCSSCTTCSSGYIETVSCTGSSNRVCSQCIGDTYRFSTTACASCLQCTAGQEQILACSSTSNRQCQSCVARKFKAASGNGMCSDCPSNSNSVSGATGCVCNVGFGGINAQSCTACAIGEFKGSIGNTPCSPCPTSTFSFTNGSSACRTMTCPVQEFVSTAVSNVAHTCGTTQNEPCITSSDEQFVLYPGSYGNDGNDDGTFVDIEATTVGTQIVFMIDFGKEQIIQFIMFYNRNEDCCRGRPNGASIRVGPTSAWAASTACAALNSESVQTLDCNLQGQYIFIVLPVLTSPTILNFYEFKAFSACSRCPAFSASQQGSILSTSCECNSGYIGQSGGVCTECAVGKYKTGMLTCTKCPTGKYSSLPARGVLSDCLSCETGKYGSISGLTMCGNCEAGKYQGLIDQVQCEPCPTNQASGNGFSSCVLCSIGKYWSIETSLCTECVGSTYKSQVGSAMCQSCVGDSVFTFVNVECTQLTQSFMSGYYYEGLNCVLCPHNHTTPANPAIYYRNSCFCLPGFGKKSNIECISCTPGFYSSNIDMSCTPSPRGTFVHVPGSISYKKCLKNWVSFVQASISCTPCPSTSYSNSQNTLCLPGNENNLAPTTTQQFKISVFCVDSGLFGLNSGFVTMEKQSGVRWDASKQAIISYYPNFVDENAHFCTNACAKVYLHSTPTACGVNMFMMRIHSYIWECVSCPSGTYKNTFSLSYTDCKPCSAGFCPELKQTCDASNSIHIMPSDPMYTNYFKSNY